MIINIFEKLGISAEEIENKKKDIFNTFFHGSEDERIFHEADGDMGYLVDTGNIDARTEGMSYGMMMCVQMDMKKEFDAIWKWAKTHMLLSEGPNAGYFAWSCGLDGTKNANGAAPDGEEYFVMALFFAANRWGNGEGIYNYENEAKQLLHSMIHKGENGTEGSPMFDKDNHLIKFVAELDFTDPSYHLPHFYRLWSRWCMDEDKDFLIEAERCSREFLKDACNKETGLSAEYSHYSGKPYKNEPGTFGGRHDWYYSDAYRTILNIALDYSWFEADEWAEEEAKTFLDFFCHKIGFENWNHIFEVDGTMLDEPALHPTAIIATNAMTALILPDDEDALKCAKLFWDTPLRKGERRYYDNCLYLFAFLALSGSYKIFE